MITHNAIISEDYKGKRLDAVLAKVFTQYSRERLKSWLKNGDCLVNGQAANPRQAVIGGENVELSVVLEEKTALVPQDIPGALNIVFEDDDVIVLNKPVGLIVHPGAGNPDGTLVNALLMHDSALCNLPRAGVIHRLDKDTSGLLVVAKNIEAHNFLSQELANRKFNRLYHAIVHRPLTLGGKVDAPIGRHPQNRLKMHVRPDGKSACTHYRVLKKNARYCYLELKLETGRTHQIRVHMSHIKHPIVGDNLYANRMHHTFPRQALHAKTLGFIHPGTREYVEFSSDIPEDISNLLQDIELN